MYNFYKDTKISLKCILAGELSLFRLYLYQSDHFAKNPLIYEQEMHLFIHLISFF